MLFGCKQETYQPLNESNETINFNVNKPFNEFTEEEKLLYNKAQNIMDSHIKLEDGQYHIEGNYSNSMGISQEIYDHFRVIMDKTNESIKGLEIIQLDNSYIITNPTSTKSIVRLKSFGQGGRIDGIVGTWYGCDVYLAYNTVRNISSVSLLAGLVLSRIKMVHAGFVATFCGIAGNFVANNYPNGIVVKVATSGGTCIPFYFKSQ